MRRESALFPRAAGKERAQPGNLRIRVDLVETAEHGMLGRQVDDLALGKDALELAHDVLPLDRAVEVVEGRRPAAQEELAQDGHFLVLQPQVARLDEVDPGVLEQLRIGQREHDGIVDADGGDALEPPRQVLLGGRTVDRPRLAPVARAKAVGVPRRVLDADERPLEPAEPPIAGDLLRARREPRARDDAHRGHGDHHHAGHAPAPGRAAGHHRRPPRGAPSTIASSRSCARS